jgi:hypothetical protein
MNDFALEINKKEALKKHRFMEIVAALEGMKIDR